MRHVLPILAMLVCVLSARTATAQFLATDNRPEFITMTTSTTSAVAVGVIMLTVVSVQKDPTAMNRYLRQNEPAVRAALALGAGPIVEDLAMFFDVKPADMGRFGRLLRQHRTRLCDAAFGEPGSQTFATLVQTALLDDRKR